MNEYVTIKEIAQAKGLKSTRSIRMEINKPESKYISREVKVNGGISYEILFSSLEPELQQKLRECETKSTAIVPLNYKPPIITDKARQTANHRMNIVKAALEHRNKYPSIKEADAEFLDLYNSGLYLPKAYEFLGRISIGTLRRYIQAYKKTGNAESLIPQYKITKQGEYALNIQKEYGGLMTEETILKKANSKKGLTEEIATRKRALNFYSLANIQSENYLKMSDPIEIKIDNKEVESRLLDLAQRSENLRPLMKNIAGIFAYSTEENFKEEGRPKWENLKDSTIKQRTKNKQWPGMILQISGQLASSVNTYYDNDSAVIGSNLEYAAIHQIGGQAGRNKSVEIPARPYLQLTSEDFEEILSMTENFLGG